MSDQVEQSEIERHDSPDPLPDEQIKYRHVDIKTGLHELNVALVEGNKDAVREAFNNLTFSYPTAVTSDNNSVSVSVFMGFLELDLVQLGSI